MTPPMSENHGYRALLKNRNFAFLWLGQIFSQLADRVIFVIFIAVIANYFSTSASLQSNLYIAFTIPAIFLTSIAGVFVDKWNKKHILVTTNILRAFIIMLLPFFKNSVFEIYALAFLISCVTQFFVPAEAGLIPSLIDKKHLLTANSLFTTTMMASLVFGFTLGDPLINIFGLDYVHSAICAFFIISALFLSLIKYKNNNVNKEAHKTFKEFIDDFKTGFVYVKDTPVVKNAILKLTALFSIIVTMSFLSISISEYYLYPGNILLGAQKFVYIVAYCGLGMIIGAFLTGKTFRNIDKYKLIYSGFLLIGFGVMAMTLLKFIPNNLNITFAERTFAGIYLESFKFTARMLSSYAMAFLIGIGASIVAIPVQTVLQCAIPEDIRGKVFGVQFTFLSTFSTFPVIIASLAADVFGLLPVLFLIGFPIFFFGTKNLLKLRNQNNCG